jgi:DNA-binding transcriptional LysR family regulator
MTDEQIDIAVRIGQPRDSSAIMRKLAENRRILVAAPAYLEHTADPVPSANSTIIVVCATTITRRPGDSKDRTALSGLLATLSSARQ